MIRTLLKMSNEKRLFFTDVQLRALGLNDLCATPVYC